MWPLVVRHDNVRALRRGGREGKRRGSALAAVLRGLVVAESRVCADGGVPRGVVGGKEQRQCGGAQHCPRPQALGDTPLSRRGQSAIGLDDGDAE